MCFAIIFTKMIDVNRKKIGLVILVILLVIAGVFGYFQYRERKIFQQQVKQTVNTYSSMTEENADFTKIADGLRALLKDPQANNIKLKELGYLKIYYADALSEIDEVEAHSILKELAVDSQYPNDVRYMAINYIVNDYELAPDYEYAKKYIFTGEPYKSFLQEDDIELAIRRLNEWSDEILPNVIANYRIAKWYASQIYQNPSLPSSQRAEILGAMNERLTKADELFAQYKSIMTDRSIGLAYELKARTIYMAGESGYKEKARDLFEESHNALKFVSPSDSIFKGTYRARAELYRAAFLAKEYSDSPTEIARIKSTLWHYNDFLESSQGKQERNTRLVKFLTEARDSTDLKFPFPDFNQEDLKNLCKIDERFKKNIENLNYFEYIKGHPMEKFYEKYGK